MAEVKTVARTEKHLMLLRILMVCCVAGMVWSAWLLLSNRREYAQGDAAYRQIRELTAEAGLLESTPQEFTPSTDSTGQIDFVSLQAINSDTTGWLRARGSVIDYPVVQGEDNEYYLTHLLSGEDNKLGCLFVDYRNQRDFSDPNTVIYGHNMKDGSMFSPLTQYQKQSYYDNMPEMQLFTPHQEYRIQLFAGVLSDASYRFIRFDFEDDGDFLSYIDVLKSQSTFQSDVAVEAGERLITLSTCSYAFQNARYTLFGKLVPVNANP